MFYADISPLNKAAARHMLLREIEDSPEGRFTRRRSQFGSRYLYDRDGIDFKGRALTSMRELDAYGLFHLTRLDGPNPRAEANVSLSGVGRRTLAHWDGVVDLPYSITVNGQRIDFTIDLTGRVRAPGLAPFDVRSPAEARDTIRAAFDKAHRQDDEYDDRSARPLRSEEWTG